MALASFVFNGAFLAAFMHCKVGLQAALVLFMVSEFWAGCCASTSTLCKRVLAMACNRHEGAANMLQHAAFGAAVTPAS